MNHYIDKSNYSASPDIDVREAVHEIIYGSQTESPRGRWAVLQILLRDKDGKPLPGYNYKLSAEGKDMNRGDNTTRTGYLCTEKLVRVTHRPAAKMMMDEQANEMGNQIPVKDVIYLSYKDPVKEHDVCIFIKTDEEGNIVNPVTPTKEVIITDVYPKISDLGRTEYYACIVEEQK